MMFVKQELDVRVAWVAVNILRPKVTLNDFEFEPRNSPFKKLHGSDDVVTGVWRPQRLPLTLSKMCDLYELRRKYIPINHTKANYWYMEPPAERPVQQDVEIVDDDLFADDDERDDFLQYIDAHNM
jgi:hypothetical protein